LKEVVPYLVLFSTRVLCPLRAYFFPPFQSSGIGVLHPESVRDFFFLLRFVLTGAFGLVPRFLRGVFFCFLGYGVCVWFELVSFWVLVLCTLVLVIYLPVSGFSGVPSVTWIFVFVFGLHLNLSSFSPWGDCCTLSFFIFPSFLSLFVRGESRLCCVLFSSI